MECHDHRPLQSKSVSQFENLRAFSCIKKTPKTHQYLYTAYRLARSLLLYSLHRDNHCKMSTRSPARSKRTELSLVNNVELIKTSAGKTHRQLAEELNIERTQVGTILKRKAELMDALMMGMPVTTENVSAFVLSMRISKRQPGPGFSTWDQRARLSVGPWSTNRPWIMSWSSTS